MKLLIKNKDFFPKVLNLITALVTDGDFIQNDNEDNNQWYKKITNNKYNLYPSTNNHFLYVTDIKNNIVIEYVYTKDVDNKYTNFILNIIRDVYPIDIEKCTHLTFRD